MRPDITSLLGFSQQQLPRGPPWNLSASQPVPQQQTTCSCAGSCAPLTVLLYVLITIADGVPLTTIPRMMLVADAPNRATINVPRLPGPSLGQSPIGFAGSQGLQVGQHLVYQLSSVYPQEKYIPVYCLPLKHSVWRGSGRHDPCSSRWFRITVSGHL